MSINSLSLALLTEDVVTKLFIFRKPITTIGRGIGSDIHIDQCGVSNDHARIRAVPSKYMANHHEIILEDLDSRNGTLVNDERITSHHLQPNDVITIAWTRFKVIADLESRDATTAYMLLD